MGELIEHGNLNALLTKISRAKLVIAVGDATCRTLRSMGRRADIELMDGKEQRRDVPLEASHTTTVRITNPAGQITVEAKSTLKRILPKGRRVTFIIEGEEDLLAIPTALYAPLGSTVLYGQPGRGIVVLEVDRELKKRMRQLLRDLRQDQRMHPRRPREASRQLKRSSERLRAGRQIRATKTGRP